MTRGTNYWMCCALVSIGLLAAGSAQPALATYLITEDFDSEPATWVGSENKTDPQDFGWSDTNYAVGADTGEIGGRFSRNSLAMYWTDVGSLDISSDSLSLSGRGYFAGESEQQGNSFLAWFDSTTSLDWEPNNYIGIRTDCTDVYLVYAANGGTETSALIGGNLGSGDGASWSFTFSYDPAGNGGTGTITASVNGGSSVVQNLATGDKDAMTDLNRFGLLTLFNGGEDIKYVYYDDLSYTSAVPEPGTLALLAAGLIGLLCYAWQKRK